MGFFYAKAQSENYSQSKEIAKPLDEVLNFFREYIPTSTGNKLGRWAFSSSRFLQAVTGKMITNKDVCQGCNYIIERGFDDINNSNKFTATISFFGKVATQVRIDIQTSNPRETVDWLFKELDQAVKDCEKPAQQQAAAPVVEDYSQSSLPELLDIFDAKVKMLGAMPNMANLMVVKNVRLAIGTKIDALPLAERGKFTKATGNIDTYLGTINTQLSNPMTANMISQFIGTYISQIQGSISEIAAAL